MVEKLPVGMGWFGPVTAMEMLPGKCHTSQGNTAGYLQESPVWDSHGGGCPQIPSV